MQNSNLGRKIEKAQSVLSDAFDELITEIEELETNNYNIQNEVDQLKQTIEELKSEITNLNN